jgi:hypothetical protein
MFDDLTKFQTDHDLWHLVGDARDLPARRRVAGPRLPEAGSGQSFLANDAHPSGKLDVARAMPLVSFPEGLTEASLNRIAANGGIEPADPPVQRAGQPGRGVATAGPSSGDSLSQGGSSAQHCHPPHAARPEQRGHAGRQPHRKPHRQQRGAWRPAVRECNAVLGSGDIGRARTWGAPCASAPGRATRHGDGAGDGAAGSETLIVLFQHHPYTGCSKRASRA